MSDLAAHEAHHRVIEHTTIPMSDGTHLAARIWLPDDAESQPVPAILEYIPYRKRDFTRSRDETMHPVFADNGYAGVRVDLRGSGDSEGVLEDEYLELELQDGVEVIEWLAKQPWCDGSVAMIGISWGGFNGLQVAARQPEALKAVISVCSTDDRYADDVHYMGGCLLGDNLSWASVMFAFNSLPPDPQLVGEQWRDLWFKRLEGSGLWLEKWLTHQTRDDFWRHGSICKDFSSVFLYTTGAYCKHVPPEFSWRAVPGFQACQPGGVTIPFSQASINILTGFHSTSPLTYASASEIFSRLGSPL